MRIVVLLGFALSIASCDDGGTNQLDADLVVDADRDLDGDIDGDDDTDVDGDQDGGIPDGCNPLAAEWDCLLPYPSDFFLVDDATMPSGRRIAHPGPGLPVIDGATVEFRDRVIADGFPTTPNIIALFPMGIDETDSVFHTDDVSLSTSDDSATLLVNVSNGERVVHFAEVDPRADLDELRALIIHPLVPLEFDTRYIVAIRGLRDRDGEEIEAPAGFAALRDGRGSSDPLVAALAERYEDDIFAALATQGVPRDELQLAWDFTTETAENRMTDMLRVRELVMEACEASPPPVVIRADGIEDDVDEHIARRVRGVIETPMYLESTETGAALNRGADGRVEQNGTVDVDFVLLIPRSVAEGPERVLPGRLVQFGHGFFGTRDELDDEFGHAFANHTSSVMVGVDWWGMNIDDRVAISTAIFTDFPDLVGFTDRVHQAMANQIAVTYAARSSMETVDELHVDGALAFDPTETYYYGISNGHILGATYVALSPHISRATFGVGGMGYSLIAFRSLSFASFLFVIELVTDDPLDLQKLVSMFQSSLDRIDPAVYSRHLLDDLFVGSPVERRVLMHGGIGDASMPNLATQAHARALGIPLLTPAPRTVYGLETVEAPHDGSAFVEFDFGVPEPLPGTYAQHPQANDVHDRVRLLGASMDQVDAFFRPDGVVLQTCEGPCDPE